LAFAILSFFIACYTAETSGFNFQFLWPDSQELNNVGGIASGSIISDSGSLGESPYLFSTTSFTLLSDVSSVFISFTGGGDANSGGIVLDNVSLERTDSFPVPEPTVIAIFGLGILGFGLPRFKKQY
jgi:hypothetical protein